LKNKFFAHRSYNNSFNLNHWAAKNMLPSITDCVM